MHQGAAGEGEERFGGLAGGAWVAIGFVLPDRIGNVLGVIGLELGGGNRNAVEEEHQIESVLVMQRITHLPHHAQAVGVVAGQDGGVEPEGGFELRQLEGLGQAEHFHTLAEQIEGAELIELAPYPLQQGVGRLGAVVFLQHLPGFWLGVLHPGDQIRWIERKGAVIGSGAALLVEPAVGAEMLADLALEGDLVLQAHGLSG